MTNRVTTYLVGPRPMSKLTDSPDNNIDKVIFVDGGLYHEELFKHLKGVEKISVGDKDSYHGPKTHHLQAPANKDESDLALALKQVSASSGHIKLYGLTGGRLDHQLCNIGEVIHYLKDHKNIESVQFYSDFSDSDLWHITIFPPGTHGLNVSQSMANIKRETISILSLEEQEVLLSGSLEYTGDKISLTALSSLGLSNVATGSYNIKCTKPIIIIRNQEEFK